MSPRPRQSQSAFQLDVEELYVRLDRERRARRMSWRAISRETGISQSTFSRLAYGRGRPDGDSLVALMAWLGLTDITAITRTRDEEEPSQ